MVLLGEPRWQLVVISCDITYLEALSKHWSVYLERISRWSNKNNDFAKKQRNSRICSVRVPHYLKIAIIDKCMIIW